MDSNHRRQSSRQIYSLFPLATRAPTQIDAAHCIDSADGTTLSGPRARGSVAAVRHTVRGYTRDRSGGHWRLDAA